MTPEEQTAINIRRKCFLRSLRDLADFLDEHPQVPIPYKDTMNVFVNAREELAAIIRGSGHWEKSYVGNYFSIAKEFGEDLSYEVNVGRDQVCHKVVTGTRVVPAVEAQPEHEELIEEWICDEPSLLASTAAHHEVTP